MAEFLFLLVVLFSVSEAAAEAEADPPPPLPPLLVPGGCGAAFFLRLLPKVEVFFVFSVVILQSTSMATVVVLILPVSIC